MAFVNEYVIPEEDYEKYDLRKICGEHNLPWRGIMHSRDWTVDRDREAFLIKTWSHQESRFEGYAFYWKGAWMFFEMQITEGESNYKTNPDNASCWYRWLVKDFVIPSELEAKRDELMSDLQAAITQKPGSATVDYTHRSATIEFI